MKRTFEEEKQYLADLASEKLEYLVPFVVTDPEEWVDVEEFIPYKTLSIDLAATKAGDFESFVKDFKKRFAEKEAEIVLIKNIDNISSRKDKLDWEQLVIVGLKSEDYTHLFNDASSRTVPFSKIRIICTCKSYPDYLKKRGNLGIGPDFTPIRTKRHGTFSETYIIETKEVFGEINPTGGWVVGPFFKMPEIPRTAAPEDIILKGDCRHEEQAATKESRMDFTLTAGGVLTISGNDWLCAVDDVELSPNPHLDNEIDVKMFRQSMFKNLDFHTVVIEKGVGGLREYSLAGCKNLKQIVINTDEIIHEVALHNFVPERCIDASSRDILL